MTKRLSEMTRADWLTRRWLNTTPPGGPEMQFTDDGDFPPRQRAVMLAILKARAAWTPDQTVREHTRAERAADSVGFVARVSHPTGAVMAEGR